MGPVEGATAVTSSVANGKYALSNPPKSLTTTASVDTVELFLRKPTSGLRRRIEGVSGQRVQIKDCIDRTGRWRGVRVIINRPTLASLAALNDVNRAARGSVVSRADIAIDFAMNAENEADALADWIDHYVSLKWRSSKTRKKEDRGTIYWCDAHKGRNLASYRKRRQSRRVVRLEIRFYGAASVRRAGLSDLAELPSINPQRVFAHHVKAMRFTEKFKIKVMRQAVSNDRKRAATSIERPRGKRTQRLVDKYRAAIPRRIRYMLELTDAQNMVGRRGIENVSLAFLRIPEHVTWPALKSKENSGEGAMVGDYYGSGNRLGNLTASGGRHVD